MTVTAVTITTRATCALPSTQLGLQTSSLTRMWGT
jgi:hypothetical protein